jgi:hypothetical protein
MKQNNQRFLRLTVDLTPKEKEKIRLLAIKSNKTMSEIIKEFISKLEVN